MLVLVPAGDETAALLNTHRSDGGLSDILNSRGLIGIKPDDSGGTHTGSWSTGTHSGAGGEPPRLSLELVSRLAPRTSEALRLPHAKVRDTGGSALAMHAQRAPPPLRPDPRACAASPVRAPPPTSQPHGRSVSAG